MIDATSVWLKQLERLVQAPELEIRGAKVKERFGEQLTIDMNAPFVRESSRKISEAFRFAEAYWILSGDNKVSSICPYAPSIEYFSDNGYVFQGAYGPKVTEQLLYVCDNLKLDFNSRQAVISIWRENPRVSKDIPCTLTLQFLIRNSAIHCVATMRSSDIWLGLPYDIFNFTCITEWIRLAVNKAVGPLARGSLIMNLGSSHLYVHNYERAEATVNSDRIDDGWDSSLPVTLPEFEEPEELIAWLESERDHYHEG